MATAKPKKEAAAAAPAAAKEAKPAKEPVIKDTAHGVTRPKSGTATGRVWEVSDEISRETKAPAKRAAVIEKCTAEGINGATAATQYGRWRTYNGLAREEKAAAE